MLSLQALPRVVSHFGVLTGIDEEIFAHNSGPPRKFRDRSAAWRFPDAASCLAKDATADVPRIDFRNVRTRAEAEVCLYRVLDEAGPILESRKVLEAQGFRVSSGGFSPETPFENRDGTVRVAASWSIKKHGPRFPETGLLKRTLSMIPYGMSINAYYTSDGKQMIAVRLDINTT